MWFWQNVLEPGFIIYPSQFPILSLLYFHKIDRDQLTPRVSGLFLVFLKKKKDFLTFIGPEWQNFKMAISH